MVKGKKTHNYISVNTSHYDGGIVEAANECATRGWRVVSVIPAQGPGYADSLFLERPVWVEHPND